MKAETIAYQQKEETVLERINKSETVYLCIDDNDAVQFGTPSYCQAHQFARTNKCFVSEYPKGTLSN